MGKGRRERDMVGEEGKGRGEGKRGRREGKVDKGIG